MISIPNTHIYTPKDPNTKESSIDKSGLRIFSLWELVETARVFPTGIPLKDSFFIFYPFDYGLPTESLPKTPAPLTGVAAAFPAPMVAGNIKSSSGGFAISGSSALDTASTKETTPDKDEEVFLERQDKLLDYWTFQRCRPDWRERLELFGYQDAFDV